MAASVDMKERYRASMVLSGVGDALAYNNGHWEFCHNGRQIYDELEELGGLKKISMKSRCVSDDTVLHIANAEALVSKWSDREELFRATAAKYKEAMRDMAGRSPGATTSQSVYRLKPRVPRGYVIPFNARGGGCGAAMRSMCIGLFYPRREQLPDLIAVSVETGRMTHNHPTGYLGAFAAALMTSYAVQGRDVRSWGVSLMDTLPDVWKYVEEVGRDVKENRSTWDYFTDQWKSYLKIRGIQDGQSDPKFPQDFDFEERDVFYKSLSFAGWGGASGHDAPMIAYDALLGAGDCWSKLCDRGLFHGGDSDSTGVIAGACWGALYGFHNVPKNNYEKLEYRDRLGKLADMLLERSVSEK
ncbi:ADP-ribosylhydrolase ARH1-like [Corticium candelabrum]|uniref:ADP-ribosylhydrolase ARH1-like n=1 Tax=Corticium candelabrum TaxID=121492 RepID=UPI002E2576FF|nr:ADP-ribosylhydrolase ARH1-like [Corticium candelabrum]